jgi:integral membrane sensor domain MASE1
MPRTDRLKLGALGIFGLATLVLFGWSFISQAAYLHSQTHSITGEDVGLIIITPVELLVLIAVGLKVAHRPSRTRAVAVVIGVEFIVNCYVLVRALGFPVY